MDDSFASSISELLLEFIIKVLKKPTSDITKCICQAFKVSQRYTVIILSIFIFTLLIRVCDIFCDAVSGPEIGKGSEQGREGRKCDAIIIGTSDREKS